MRYVGLLILILLAYCSYATHIVGGELNYRCLGEDTYEISLTVFRDCYNGVPPFDDPASVGVFDEHNVLLQEIQIDFVSDDTLDPVLFDPCLVIPPNVCVHRTTYIDTLRLPFIQGGYQLAYQRCCRNHTILNIIEPLRAGATYYNYISEDALIGFNNSCVFKEWPPIYICAGYPIIFDHSATDIDGDSIVYAMCAPFHGASFYQPRPQPPLAPPYDSIVWQPPYNTENMLGGIPLSIDSHTGLLTGTPYTIGQFVVGICATEYRNGKLISTTKRDFQYNVGICGVKLTANFTTTPATCNTLQVSFNNFSQGASNYLWNFGDPNTTTDISITPNPVYTYSNYGTYTITLVADPGQPCTDTFTQTITLNPPIPIQLLSNPTTDTIVCQFPISLNAYSPQASIYQWLYGSTPIGTDSLATADNSGKYTIVITDQYGCTQSRTIAITDEPANITAPDLYLCLGQSDTISVTSFNPTHQLNIQVTPPDFVLQINENNILVHPTTDITYIITATNQYGCTDTDTANVNISSLTPPLAATAQPDTIYPGQPVQLSATNHPDYTYYWTPTSYFTTSTNLYNPIVAPLTSTTYFVSITDRYGCSNTAEVPIYVRNFICDEPYIFIPNAFSPNGDQQNDQLYVRANAITDLYFAVYNRWGEKVFETTDLQIGWDGTFKGTPLPPDVFAYYVSLRCLNGQPYYKQGNVTLLR